MIYRYIFTHTDIYYTHVYTCMLTYLCIDVPIYHGIRDHFCLCALHSLDGTYERARSGIARVEKLLSGYDESAVLGGEGVAMSLARGYWGCP